MSNCKTNADRLSNVTPYHRKLMFYCICIWVRILLGLLIWYNQKINQKIINLKYFKYLVLVGGCVGVYLNYINLSNKCVWWSRLFHLITSLVVVLLSILSIFGVVDIKYVAFVIWVDVLYGFTSSLYLKPWN